MSIEPPTLPSDTSSTSTGSWFKTLPKGARLPEKLSKRVDEYKHYGKEFTKLFVEIFEHLVEKHFHGSEKAELKGLYTMKRVSGCKDTNAAPYIPSASLERMSRLMIRFAKPLQPTDPLAFYLNRIIDLRQELRRWHDRLDPEDERFEENKAHQAYIDTLITARSILSEETD